MQGTACVAPGACIAVGAYSGDNQPTTPLIETLAAGVWTPLVAPLPPDAVQSSAGGALLTSIACPTRQWCVAVGSYTSAGGSGHGLVETFAHGIWTASTVPAPAKARSASTGLASVACTGVHSCMAVGGYATAGQAGGLIGTLTSNRWVALAAPVQRDH